MTRRRYTNVLLAICGFVFLGGAEGDGCLPPLIDNNGFDLWCGEELCSWELESGSIEKAPTWHESDHAVSLVGSEVSISQFGDETTSCYELSMVADIGPDTEVFLQLDLDDDDTIDWEARIPTTDWEPVIYWAPAPQTHVDVRYRLRKSGNGRAVVAQLRAERGSPVDCGLPVAAEDDACGGDGDCGVVDALDGLHE